MKSSFIPGTKAGPGGSPVFPPGLCVVVPVLVCAGAHVCDQGDCPRSWPPGFPEGIYPWSLAIRSAQLAPLLGAQRSPPASALS